MLLKSVHSRESAHNNTICISTKLIALNQGDQLYWMIFKQSNNNVIKFMSSFHFDGLVSFRLLFSHHSIPTFFSCFLPTLSAFRVILVFVSCFLHPCLCRSWFPSRSCQVVLSALISGVAYFPASAFSCNWPLFWVSCFSELSPVMLYLCLVPLFVCFWLNKIPWNCSFSMSFCTFLVCEFVMNGQYLKNTQRIVFLFRIKDFILTSVVSSYIH